MNVRPTSLKRLKKAGLAAVVAAAAITGLAVVPAHASAASIATTANAEVGNGPCAHGGYESGAGGQTSSCGSGGGQSHAWCSDFVGWVWAQNGAAHLGDLDDRAASVYEYGKRYGTLHNTPQVGDAVVYNYSASAAYADHVALVTAVGGGSVTIVGGNEGHSSGHTEGIVQRESTSSYAVGDAPWGQTISGYISPVGVSNADITGDGKADLMVLSTDGTIGRRVGNGTSFGGSTTVSAGWQNYLGHAGQGKLYFADINGDGKKDLVVLGTDGTIGVRLNNGDGSSFGASTTVSSGWQNYLGQPGQGRLTFPDINGDGKADLVIQSTDGTIATHLGSGTSFGANLPLSLGWQNYLSQAGQGRLTFPDINGDGKADLVIQGTDGTIATHLGSGTSFGANLPLSAGWQNYLSQPGQGRLTFPDINGDGKADLVIQGTDGTVATHLGSGTSFGANLPLSAGWQNYLGQAGQGDLYFE